MRDAEFVGYFLLGELSFGLFDDLGNKFGPLNGRFAIAPADVEAFVGVALEREAEKVSFLADPDCCDLGFGVDTSLETPTAGLAVYDLETGERVRYTDLDAVVTDDAAHTANDVAVAPDGTAYVTDPVAGIVYEVEPDGDASVLR